jgi:hypothetical protein
MLMPAPVSVGIALELVVGRWDWLQIANLLVNPVEISL